LFATTHARNAGEVERKLSNFVAHFARSRSSSDRAQDAQDGLNGPTHHRFQEADRICPDRPRDGQKLKDIDATCATLVLGNEGLMLSKPFGKLLLSDTGTFARFDQQLAKDRLKNVRIYRFCAREGSSADCEETTLLSALDASHLSRSSRNSFNVRGISSKARQ
jgi:hypothetical protein